MNVRLRELEKEYMECWNETKGPSGRCVDAVTCPVAPWPAVRRKKYSYYGYTTFVNVLDNTSVVVPVTVLRRTWRRMWWMRGISRQRAITRCPLRVVSVILSCTSSYSITVLTCASADDAEIYHGAHVGLQLVGRRLQEEKMIVLASLGLFFGSFPMDAV